MAHSDATARFAALSFFDAALGFWLDLSAMALDAEQLEQLEPKMAKAFDEMKQLEAGAIANADEERMVGHYWLRAPERAPSDDVRKVIEPAIDQVLDLAAQLRKTGALHAVMVGIGGSSLGPQLVHEALRSADDSMRLHFLDNTDPAGIDRLVAELGAELAKTVTVVVSKSGGTKETRNSMLEMRRVYERAGLEFGPNAVAITQEGSKLDAYAREHGFMARLPMWDWVGGRSSVTSAVGLLPAALQGVDIKSFLAGAAEMDALTRVARLADNPAALLAAAWYLAGEGKGRKAMVVLPYKDCLALIARYLQQLVMESLGKREDRAGQVVQQGITVYGNKGSTDQHAYVQQLLDGPDDFFITFIEVLQARVGEQIEVEPGVTSGDYLFGFLQGTRRALAERGRQSLTISLERVDAKRIGALIALYERAVGLYASLINVNAYHQPAVESGKRAAAQVLALQGKVIEALSDEARSAQQIASSIGSQDALTVLFILRQLAANGRAAAFSEAGKPYPDTRFSVV